MVWVDFAELQDYFAFNADVLLSKWPHPETDRIQAAFRMQLGNGKPYPRPGRFILAMEDVPNEPDGLAYPVIDMTINGDFRLRGVSGQNELGREVELDIIQYLDDDFDGSDLPGIEYRFTFTMPGFDDYHHIYFYEWIHPGGINKDINYRSHNVSVDPVPLSFKDDISELNVDWPAPPSLGPWSFRPMSECYTFPAPPPVEGFAAFNGIDAYIALDHNTITHQGPHFCEAEIRVRDDAWFSIFGRETSNSIWGGNTTSGHWSIRSFASMPWPSLGTWFKYRQEFEWSEGVGLQYDFWIDDTHVLLSAQGRINTFWQNLGVRNRSGAPIFGDFDLRNLVYKTGSFASPVTRLDMPLIDNALDLSPDENHGTTFNMALPST
jgi:hypothetical protein